MERFSSILNRTNGGSNLVPVPRPQKEPAPRVNGPRPSHTFALLGSSDPNDPRVFFTCPVCGPIYPMQVPQGYVRRECKCEMAARHKLQDEKTFAAEQAKAKEKQRKREKAEATTSACYTWLGEDYSDYGMDAFTFENFNAYNMNMRIFYNRMLELANDIPNTIILSGPCGTGKTHLACALLNRWRKAGMPGLFTTGANLFNALLACGDDFQAKQAILTKMYKTPLFLIDDPDHSGPTNFKQDTYKEIFTKRCARGLSTIITTNIIIESDVTEMAHILGDSAASRLNIGMVLVRVDGNDYRKKLNRKG